MTIRITGMNSGLDTEAIIQELASARSIKVQNVQKEQTKLSWKIDAWKELNAKIYSLYTDVLSDMRFDYAYSKKTTKVSNPNAASVVTSGDAVNGVQSLQIQQVAKSSYLTGGKIGKKAAALSGDSIRGAAKHLTGGEIAKEVTLTGGKIQKPETLNKELENATLQDLGLATDGQEITFKVTVGKEEKEVKLQASDTLTLSKAAEEIGTQTGLLAAFDKDEGRFAILSPGGANAAFTISAATGDGAADSAALLKGLGLDVAPEIKKGVTSATKLSDLGISSQTSITLKVGTAESVITLEASATLADVANELGKVSGVYAQFDADAGSFRIGAKDAATEFAISGDASLLGKLGLDVTPEDKITGNTTLAALEMTGDANGKISLGLKIGENAGSIEFDVYDTLDDVAAKFREKGLNARFDEALGRFEISAQDTQTTFAISEMTGDTNSGSLLDKLGLKKEPKTENITGGGSTKLSELGFGTEDIKFKLTIGGKAEEVTLKASQTLNEVADIFKEKGLNAKFDEGTGRFFISAKESGEANGFTIEAQTVTGVVGGEAQWGENLAAKKALQNLGLYYDSYYNGTGSAAQGQATMIQAQDAQITLNGVEFTSSKNTFEVNGLTITALQTTKEGEDITLTTQQDTEGIYDVIKNFIKKYNELINEMDKLYSAKSASKYEPLTSEEKDEMSEKEIEEWEKKIKESLLRRDTTLYSVSSAMKDVMSQARLEGRAGINDGKDIYLTFFGIETLGYFKAKDNEKNAYHINGDSEDSSVKNNEEKLKKAIASDPDTVISFFKNLATNLYTALDGKMARSDYSSAFTVYNDKQMEKDLKAYETKVSSEQKKLNDYIDRWYSKFSKMEVALSKIKSKESSMSGLFG